MTLLITIFAAVIATAIWYKNAPNSQMKTGMLCLIFWGASLMWLVDAIFEYVELGAKYFTPSAQDMLNDSFLGLAVVALALVIWIVAVLVTDPKGVIRTKLFEKQEVSKQKASEQGALKQKASEQGALKQEASEQEVSKQEVNNRIF